MLIATIATLGLLTVSAPGQKAVNHKVKIDGRTYRVEVKGNVVEVFDKSVMTKRSPEARLQLRKAVRAATGCAITDDYWETAHLVGLLDCASASSAQGETP